MPIYRLNGEVYDIPEDVVADFEKDNPSATVTYHAGDDEYEIPVSERDAFLKDFPEAQTESTTLAGKPQDTVKTTKNGGGYMPSADEMKGFQNAIGQAQQTVRGSQQSAKRIDARQKNARKTNYGLTPDTPKLGQNRKVVATDPHFDLESGQMESTYITEQGNEYQTREVADIEQNAVDIAKRRMSLPGQLEDAYAERERLQAEIDAETQRIGYGQSPERSYAPQVPGSIPRQSAERLSNDRLQTLLAAQRQNEERITALEAERDDDGGTQFWRGFLDAAKNPSTWTFGATDFQNMTQLMRIKGKVDGGEELTDDEETLLKNTMANGYAQQMFGENRGFMYRAGGISMQALPFVAEFMATGGFSSLTKMGANAGTRVAEKFALEGLKKTLLRNTGVVMGDIASSFIMANTTGAARTGADIMERTIGHVTVDEEGNYQFEGGKSLGRSIYEGEVASTLEYYTEKLGEHLQLGNWIAKGADKMGLSKLSKAVGYLSNSKMLNAGGIQDYPSEVVEEQANLLLNAILVGDNNFNGPSDPHSVINPKTQIDIWGGMLFSIGLMQAPRLAHTGYNAAGYYAYKHGLDVADTKAASVFGADKWQMVKDEIDNSDNENISEVLASVVTGDMSSEQKEATMFYADNLLKMRGFNNGMMADVRNEASAMPQHAEQDAETFLSHGIDQGYQQGHEAQEPDEKKMFVDEANEAEARLSELFTEQDVQFITNTEPMNAINIMLSNRGSNPGEWNDDEIAAVVDYYQKQARAQGVMDAAADDVEYQVARANAEVDANTHKALNQMIMAESGGEQFYIVGGDVALLAGETSEHTGYHFDYENTGDALVVRNAETGEISVKSPQMLSQNMVSDPNQLKMLNETQLRQEVTQLHDDEITFGSPAQEVFQLNDTVTLNDGQGNVIEGEIGMMPNVIDGAYVVYTSDGRALQFTGDELNKMVVRHNGQEVERATAMPQPTEQAATQPVEDIGDDYAGGERTLENANEADGSNPPAPNVEPGQPQSALDRIPVFQDASGKPILNKKGKKQYQWHKASVDDTADALTELAGGDMLMARDTATDLINNARGKLEKIRKQKPRGDDPIEIAESRAEIRRQEQEQQDIISHWQKVNQTIQNRMRVEAAAIQQRTEQAKSEEQKAREAEEARIRQEKLDEIERQRLRESIEKDHERRNKEYEPLVQARKEMADDSDAMAILQDTEPRDLREWVSSLLRPHSILWQDASESEVGLRSELGLQRSDMQRFMTLLGNKENGAVPFGKAVLDIYEGLPEGLKEQYNDQDVRNVVLDLFQSAANSREMMNLTAENRIAEAKSMRENRMAQEAEWEMEAWCEHYHLTPEERATFEDFISTIEPPYAVEESIINQIIADNEQDRTSARLDRTDVPGGNEGEPEGGESQVQGTVEAAGDGTHEEGSHEAAEAATGESSVSGDNVPGRVQSIDREALRDLFLQIGADEVLADRISDYDVEQLTAMVEDWEIANDEYGQTIEEQKDALKSKNKETREAAQKAIDDAQMQANTIFVPIEEYVEGLNAKYAIESEKPFEGAIPTPKIDKPRYNANRQALIDAYKSGDPAAITQAAQAIQQYVDEGLDAGEDKTEMFDIAENYDGNDSEKLADQYIIRTFWDRYLDDDEDQEYIKTGLKANMSQSEQLKPTDLRDAVRPESPEIGVSGANARAREATGEPKPIGKSLWGNIYDQFRGKVKEAVDFLKKHHDSDLLGVFSRKEVGDIDLIWGDETGGLDHILKKHVGPGKSFVTEDEAIAEIANIINNGIKDFENGDKVVFRMGNKTVTIRKNWREKGKKIADKNWVLTAYDEMSADSESLFATNKGLAGLATDKSSSKGTKKSGNRQGKIGKTSSSEEISSEEAKVNTKPTEGQKEAGNYQKGHINVDGYDITIENPKGSIRRGTDANGTPWETEMHNTYGYIRGTEGVDGDHIDVFLSENPTGGNVFVIDQISPDTGAFDEHKVMYGFSNEEEARQAYLSNYAEGWQGLGKITEVSRGEFKKWVESSHRKTKPFAEYKSVKKAAPVAQHTEQATREAAGTVANASGNRLVSDERYEQLKDRMRKKLLGQMNMGIDPEILAIGTEMAVYHIEKGARAFAEYAKGMIADLGDAIRPYLKAFYNGARDLPEMSDFVHDMDEYGTVQAFDVFNFDKQQAPTPVEKAQQVVSQKKADKEAAEAVKKILEIAKKDGSKKSRKNSQQVQVPSLFDMFEEESNPAQTESKPAKQETPAKSTSFLLSKEEKDKEGNRMYERNGTIDLWNASPLFTKAKRQDAPIRLSDRNMKHIISRHSDRLDSEEKVFAFLDNVFANATKLRRARGRGMFVVVENDNTDSVAMIRLMPSGNGDYYNIDTAGYYRKNKWKESEEVIADLSEPGQSDAAADTSKPQIPDENGREPINTEAQQPSSEGKGTKNIDTIQEKDKESDDKLLREGDYAHAVALSGRKRSPKEQQERELFAERQWHRAHERATESIEKLNLTGKVTVVDSIDELLGGEKMSGRQKRSKGWYDPETDRIVIVIGNHRSPEDVVRTILHEGVAHYGLRKLFGDNFDQFLDNVYANSEPRIRVDIDALATNKHGSDTRKATEEYLAGLAEDTDFENAENRPWLRHWFNQVKSTFLNLLKQLGLPFYHPEDYLTDNELRYILWRSYKNLSEPGRYRNVFHAASDVNMKKSLGIGGSARIIKMGHIEDEIPLTVMNHKDEEEIRARVNEMSLDEARKTYERINNKMLDENGLDIDEHEEKVRKGWIAVNGTKGLGKVMAESLQAAMDKYGSGMITLRWELQDHIAELEAREPLMRDGEESDVPVSMARQIYEDAIRDTGERMMIPALLSSIGSKENWTRFKHKFAESWFDYSRSIKALQDAIEKATGKAIEGFEDVWRALNSKSSVDNVELQRVMHDLVEPLSEYVGEMIKSKEIDGRKMTIDDVEKYMNAVHGIERNVGMAMKQAQDEYEENIALQKQQLENGELSDKERKSVEAALLIKEARFYGIKNYMDNETVAKWYNQWQRGLENARTNGTITEEKYQKAKAKMETEYEQGQQYKYRDKDYSGLTALFGEDIDGEDKPTEVQLEQAARDYAAKFEDIVGKESADGLWQHVRALNGWSLRKSYESGLISKEQYQDTLSMYQHYVPLRGWHDDYAGDVYQYISRGEPAEVLQGVLKKAYGRKSRAARIFGTMAAMANTAIVQGNKNLVAQRLLNMAMNHLDSGLLMISEQWYQKTADGELVPQMPNLRDDMTADEMRQELERFEEDMKAREDAGEVQTLRKKFKKEFPMHMAKWQEQRHAVRILRNGKENMVYILGDPRAAEAFNGLLNPNSQPGVVSNIISRYMRFLAKMQTSLSPEFLVSNFQRDVLTASTGAYVKFGKDYQKDFIRNLSSVMPLTALVGIKKGKGRENIGGIFSLFRKYDAGKLDDRDETERLFKEFVEFGGMTGISYITKAEEYQASMEEIIKRMRQGKMGKVRNGLDAVSDAVEFANKGIENATRFATYMTSRKRGRSVRDSIFDAKEGSVNFNMKGSGSWGNMLARRMYLYVNPAMQSLRMLGTWYENDPAIATKEGGKMVAKTVGRRFMKAAAATLAASVGTAMLNIMLSQLLHGDGDDDDKKGDGDWWALSEWNRYNFVNVINPFGKGYFHWSIPQELRPLWALGQISIDMACGRVTWQRGMQSMLLQLNNLSPLSFFEGGTDTDESIISSELRTLTPSYVSTFTDAYGWNRDFMGHKITNQGDWNKNKPEWQRAGKNTPQFMITASRKWNELTGGRRNKKSRADSPYLNPSALYYVFIQQFGGIGSMSKRMFSAFDQWRDPEQEVEMRNMPFVPKFYVATGDDYSKDRVTNDKFWMYYNEFKDADKEMASDRSSVSAGDMTQAEADKTIEERKADGTYNIWKVIDDNSLDYVFDKVRGTSLEKDVKRMIVDAVENGTVPDYSKFVKKDGDKAENEVWEKAISRQREHAVANMTDEEVVKAFDATDDQELRKEMARRISKDAGASKDTYGNADADSKMGTKYEQIRTANDVTEDALLYSYQEKAKKEGNKALADEISKERSKPRNFVRNNYHFGEKYGLDSLSMVYIRRERKKLLEKYGPKD